MTRELAKKIAKAIERDLRDRRGLRQAFESIDEDMQEEIRERWIEIIDEMGRPTYLDCLG